MVFNFVKMGQDFFLLVRFQQLLQDEWKIIHESELIPRPLENRNSYRVLGVINTG